MALRNKSSFFGDSVFEEQSVVETDQAIYPTFQKSIEIFGSEINNLKIYFKNVVNHYLKIYSLCNDYSLTR